MQRIATCCACVCWVAKRFNPCFAQCWPFTETYFKLPCSSSTLLYPSCYMLSVSIEQESYFKGPIVSGSILLTTVVSCRCGCYITQWPAYPERCSLLRGASCSTQVVWPWVGTWCPAVRIGYYFSRAEVPGSAKDHVCQMARRISWHREPAPHMAECSRCCRNDLWFSSHGGHSHSSANTADPNCRWVQHIFPSDLGKYVCEYICICKCATRLV